MRNWISKFWNDERRLNPARAVLHPAWILAVAVLLVNDHVLKPAAFAEPIAGKLSDFAGLLFAPVLLAALLGVKRRRGLWLSALAVGGVFAAINLSPGLALVWDGLVSTITPFHTTPDPTDLVALVSIPVGLWLFEPLMHRRRAPKTRRLVEVAAVTVAGLASMATSRPDPCNGADGCIEEVDQQSQVSILNKTHELHALRIRSLRETVQIDCDQVATAPNEHLADGAFGSPEVWLVQSGQEIPVSPVRVDEFGGATPRTNEPCQAVLVQSDTVPDILIFWDADLPTKSFAFDAEVPREIPADPQTVVLDADYSRTPDDQMHPWRNRGDCRENANLCGEELLEPLAEIPDGVRYSWRSQHEEPLHFIRPSVDTGTDTSNAMCALPERGDGLAWERPRFGDHFVLGIEPGIDGCHELELSRVDSFGGEPAEPAGWWLCVPFDTLDFLMPTETTYTRIAVSVLDEAANFSRGGFEGLQIDAVKTSRDEATAECVFDVDCDDGFACELEACVPTCETGMDCEVDEACERGIDTEMFICVADETNNAINNDPNNNTNVPSEAKKIYITKGFGVPAAVDFGFDVEPREGCDPVEVACGQTALPVDVVLAEYGEQVAPGESVSVGSVVPLDIYVARAEYRPVLDPACEAEDGTGTNRLPTDPSVTRGYLEAVIVAE